jgi:hypothetical protein
VNIDDNGKAFIKKYAGDGLSSNPNLDGLASQVSTVLRREATQEEFNALCSAYDQAGVQATLLITAHNAQLPKEDIGRLFSDPRFATDPRTGKVNPQWVTRRKAEGILYATGRYGNL